MNWKYNIISNKTHLFCHKDDKRNLVTCIISDCSHICRCTCSIYLLLLRVTRHISHLYKTHHFTKSGQITKFWQVKHQIPQTRQTPLSLRYKKLTDIQTLTSFKQLTSEFRAFLLVQHLFSLLCTWQADLYAFRKYLCRVHKGEKKCCTS